MFQGCDDLCQMRGQDIERGSTAERAKWEWLRGSAESNHLVGRQVMKSESPGSALKGAVDFREERQVLSGSLSK